MSEYKITQSGAFSDGRYASDQPGVQPPYWNRRPAPFYMLIIYVGIGFILAAILQLLVLAPFVDFNLTRMGDVMTVPDEFPNARIAILLAQGVSALCIFVLAPLAYLRWQERQPLRALSPGPLLPVGVLLAFAVTLIALPANAFFIEWNQNVELPSWLTPVQTWAREKEDSLAELTEYITNFEGAGQFLLALLVIAVIPAFGEELLFRGLLQNRLTRALRNPHVAIWLTAFVFSFFHFQFFGLIPRMLLGALLGYLYYWSGNLWMSVAAHFCNNGFTLLMLYLYQQDAIGVNLESPEGTPLHYSLLAGVGVAAMLFLFRRQFRPAA
ncbi:hypothetical protein SAMN05421823_103673 [Catalinimonas alkaloidigena]|uniref:CAAX prenyl protease 2/Lysostaphin resistance protein A-like domain-containing protein n=1 Tax=Catalinimonas alkaloidigena TaxID=1075417 RepID=A0A1G9F4Z9_9BACT|nr:type II CAAX endopeptidase family protein [Catalinimonas alkaloidigena]SDK83375.1 hypothetical protein SAMN05421823_103673 [Catalinimonas alkaloidigena]